jgi:thioredoxin reductase
MYDVVIVGGGPAGLSAALILGRCRRRIVLCDAGKPRNARSHGLHGFLTRDGINPRELLGIGREQLRPYGVEIRDVPITHVETISGGFRSQVEDGSCLESRKLLLATGVVDHVPQLHGMDQFYGTSVFHCPYCDGWEMRDQPLAAYGQGKSGAGLALSLKTWSRDVVLCTDGRARLRVQDRERLERHSIPVRQDRIERLEGRDGVLERILFHGGEALSRRGIFFSTGQDEACKLAANLGCKFAPQGTVHTNLLQETNVPGLYVAGDACEDVQLAIVAAAEGAKAGFAINTALQHSELA